MAEITANIESGERRRGIENRRSGKGSLEVGFGVTGAIGGKGLMNAGDVVIEILEHRTRVSPRSKYRAGVLCRTRRQHREWTALVLGLRIGSTIDKRCCHISIISKWQQDEN